MTTLAQFDKATQERATGVFNTLCMQYQISAKLFRADDVGAAVKAATTDGGSGDASFGQRMWDALLPALHREMCRCAKRGEDLPSKLDPARYALLRKALVAKFGALPESAPEPSEPEPEPDAVDAGSAEDQMAAMLRSRTPTHAPIDPEVAAILRG